MAELAFLAAVRTYLTSRPFTPPVAANRIGAIEPVGGGDLPCIVLSLASSSRRRVGLGDRSELMRGALRVNVAIDLAAPTLPDDPTFSLIDDTRRAVTLPHGGLVTSDGDEAITPLSGADVTVRLNDAPLPVVTGVPAAGQVHVDPIAGVMLTGSALPPAGTLDISYFLGQWERRVERIAGEMRLDACAVNGADAGSLCAQAVERLLAPEATRDIVQLTSIELVALGTVAQRLATPPPGGGGVTHFRRTAQLAFEFQHLIDRVESSGGVIRTIPVTTVLEKVRVDRATGAIVRETEEVT
jgi:hypothetical protein